MTKDGGPAFPLQSIGPDFQPGYSGMTLRDYFAAKAMQGLMSQHSYGASLLHENAANAYKMANAMLAEREKKGGV